MKHSGSFPGFCLVSILLLILPLVEPAAQKPANTGMRINIGLLIPDSKSPAARNGAELAVSMANKKGGINGSRINLIVKSMEGLWGTGSKQAVSLIFDDSVVAILGSHDGRNAHLVEQVSAKSRIPFLSAWTADPSLAQAFVPWFFNCVPNDILQTKIIADEICKKRRFSRVAIISDSDYDSGSTLKYLLENLKSEGLTDPIHIKCTGENCDLKEVSDKIIKADPQCVVILVQPPVSLKITGQLRSDEINIPVYCSLAQLNEDLTGGLTLENYANARFVSGLDLSSRQGKLFTEAYLKTYGRMPGAVAAYAFDGMKILIDAITIGGNDREEMRKAIIGTLYEGVTGKIRFDERGNREEPPSFVEIRDGIPVQFK